MKKISLLLVLLFTTLFQIGAEEIELTIDVDVPGTLESKIFDMNQRPLHVTKLTLTGTLDETDFKVMRETMISLHTVDISEITNVEGVNFSNHKGLRRIYLPEKLEALSSGAFLGCSALSKVDIPTSVQFIGESAFEGCSSLDSIVVPEGIISLSNNLFRNCSVLKFVDIPKSVINIGTSVFSGCSSLETVILPDALDVISRELFSGCSALKSIDIPNSVNKIGYGAFADCDRLAKITIPTSIEIIEENVFNSCEYLDTIICLAKVPPTCTELGVDELECVLVVPTIVYDDYIRHSYWGNFYTTKTIDIDFKYISVLLNDSVVGIVLGSGYYSIGDVVRIEAIAGSGYKFVEWEDRCTDNPRMIEITDSIDTNYVAIFGIDTTIVKPVEFCFNYWDLNREGVVCLAGSATDLTSGNLNSTKPIDFGSKDKRSRHTVNWKQGEFDSRTANKLRTIPEGSLVSVRLGNWEAGSQAEGIVYDYYVDYSTEILLLRYAFVLEMPGHGPMDDPYFKLEILDENYNVLNPNCISFDFTPENRDIDWFVSDGYVWKDWSSVGVNLSEYRGQTIKIRLVTRDCTRDAHAGYAYFTIDCMNSKLNVKGCADDISFEFEAPEGFRYTWTRGYERDVVVSTAQKLSVPANDTAIYYCQVDYLDTEGCGFELSAPVRHRYPYADFEWEWIPENCEENKIALINKSCVYTRIWGMDVATDEPCETLYWSIRNYNDDGENDWYLWQSERVEVTLPKEGGMFVVWVSAGISADQCIDDTMCVINVPRLGAYRDTIYADICFGDFYVGNNEFFAASGIYVDTLVSIAGCDSIIVLDLTVLPTVDVDTMITINEGEQLEFAGEIYTEAGIYHIDRFLDTVCQNITLYLIVETALEDVNVTDLVIVPNPIRVDDSAVVEYEWSDEEQEGLRVEIMNSLGQIVDVFEPKSYPIVLPRVGGVGIYYVRITTGVGSVYVGKLIVEDR